MYVATLAARKLVDIPQSYAYPPPTPKGEFTDGGSCKMPEMSDFLDRARRELSAEEVSGLKTYSAQVDGGRLLFMPVIRKMGQAIQWVSRVQVKGAMGPLPTSRASLKAIGAPEEWADKSRAFLDALQKEYPALPTAFSSERRGLGEG